MNIFTHKAYAILVTATLITSCNKKSGHSVNTNKKPAQAVLVSTNSDQEFSKAEKIINRIGQENEDLYTQAKVLIEADKIDYSALSLLFKEALTDLRKLHVELTSSLNSQLYADPIAAFS